MFYFLEAAEFNTVIQWHRRDSGWTQISNTVLIRLRADKSKNHWIHENFFCSHWLPGNSAPRAAPRCCTKPQPLDVAKGLFWLWFRTKSSLFFYWEQVKQKHKLVKLNEWHCFSTNHHFKNVPSGVLPSHSLHCQWPWLAVRLAGRAPGPFLRTLCGSRSRSTQIAEPPMCWKRNPRKRWQILAFGKKNESAVKVTATWTDHKPKVLSQQ